MPSPVEVGHADDLAGLGVWIGDGIGEAASAQAREHVQRVRAGVDRHQVGGTAGRERPGGHARRRIQAGDLGRAAGCRSPTSRSRRDRAPGGAKAPSPRLCRTLTWPVSLLVTTRSSTAAARWYRPPGRRRRPGRRVESRAAGNRRVRMPRGRRSCRRTGCRRTPRGCRRRHCGRPGRPSRCRRGRPR